jgi:hypothetical protein
MFNEFCLDEICELSERYGGIGIHCCANAKHQWDNLKKIFGLKLLNFVQPMHIIEETLTYFNNLVPFTNFEKCILLLHVSNVQKFGCFVNAFLQLLFYYLRNIVCVLW